MNDHIVNILADAFWERATCGYISILYGSVWFVSAAVYAGSACRTEADAAAALDPREGESRGGRDGGPGEGVGVIQSHISTYAPVWLCIGDDPF